MKNDRVSQRKALPDRYSTMKEVSAIMQVDEAQIKSWLEADRLYIIHFDNEPRISEAELNEFIDQCRRSGSQTDQGRGYLPGRTKCGRTFRMVLQNSIL